MYVLRMYVCVRSCVDAIYMYMVFLIFFFPSHAISEYPLQFIKQFKRWQHLRHDKEWPTKYY
jgi:hypothetical protein